MLIIVAIIIVELKTESNAYLIFYDKVENIVMNHVYWLLS